MSSHNQDYTEHEPDARSKRSLLVGYDGLNYNSVNVDANGSVSIAAGDSSSIDAFGRMRVANPQTIFDSKQVLDNQSLFWDDQEVSGSGTSSTYNQDRASSTLAVTSSTAGRRIRQTYRRFNYQPGKSQLIIMTARIPGLQSGIFQAAGYFNDDNGVFFSSDDGILYANERSNVTGTPVDTRVSQGSWSHDNLDGTGPSGITLDPTKVQILWYDLEWLGAGRVRMGFVLDGKFVKCHEFKAANNDESVYMSTANLPLRYEISNDGTGGAGASLECICATVISEGGRQDLGVVNYVSTAGSKLDLGSSGTLYAVIGFRLKSTHLGASTFPVSVSMVATTSDPFEWVILFNPTYTGGTFTYSDVSNSSLQAAVVPTGNDNAPTILTTGQVISGGYVSNQTRQGGADLDTPLRLGSAIDGTRDEIILAIRPLSANLDVYAGVSTRELI